MASGAHNPQTITPRQIPLTQGFVALVDEADFQELSQHKWCALKVPKWGKVYAVRSVLSNGKQKNEYMHRRLVGVAGLQVDHRDGNGLNNCRSNLRVATPGQNMANRGATKLSKSGYKGVSPWRKLWRAKIKAAGKIFYLGKFADKKAAALAYDAKARELHGEFARLNFPEEAQ